MIEKMNPNRFDRYHSGYWKPQGKKEKRFIHKIARRLKDLDTGRKGIYNRIGVYMEWS
jgi:hypothetical protein